MTTKSLTAAEILAADDKGLTPVFVPKWGGTVYVAALSAGDREDWESQAQGTNRKDILTSFLVLVLRDENGNKLFTDDDIVKLREKNAAVMLDLMKRGQKLNALTDQDVEEMAKN